MGKRLNDVSLCPDSLNQLAVDLERTFRSYIKTTQNFTGTRSADIYIKLQQEILKTSNVLIGTTTLTKIMTKKHPGKIRAVIMDAFKKYIYAFNFALQSPEGAGGQQIYWGVNQAMRPGAFISTIDGQFIEWDILKKELEEKVISQCPRIIPTESTVETDSFYKKENWVIHVLDPNKNKIASVWIGGNPMKNWEQDGFIRIGRTISDTEWVVYQVLARFADGSYRLVKSLV